MQGLPDAVALGNMTQVLGIDTPETMIWLVL